MSTSTWTDWSCEVRVVVDDDLPDEVSAPARTAVRSLMDDVAQAVDRFRDESELSRLNRAAPALLPLRPLAFRLLLVALDAAEQTDGACDPTVGRAVHDLGYDRDLRLVEPRAAAATATARPAPGWRRVRVDHDLRRVGLPDGVRLDLNATAKAWTADEAARRVAEVTGRSALVSIGGDLAVTGSRCWPILVSERAHEAGQHVAVATGGVATSSTVVRRWQRGDTEVHHVVDPRTGRPAAGGVRTASVWAPSCAEANAWSTAALVWGEEALERLEGRAARLVLDDGRVVTTASWPGLPEAVAS